jgi:predicted AlkP superfamily pyrophosphatase or phosphodiesterase
MYVEKLYVSSYYKVAFNIHTLVGFVRHSLQVNETHGTHVLLCSSLFSFILYGYSLVTCYKFARFYYSFSAILLFYPAYIYFMIMLIILILHECMCPGPTAVGFAFISK